MGDTISNNQNSSIINRSTNVNQYDKAVKQPKGEVSVLILTPLALELAAVLRHLTHQEEPEVKDQIAYEKGRFQGKYHLYKVVVAEPGMKNMDMALATERAIKRFEPKIALLIGIAGGVKKDVAIGDVVIAKKAYGYESGKEGEANFWARPSVESFSGELLGHAQALSRRDAWKQRTLHDATNAKVWMGPIAAGDKVVTSSNSETFQRLQNHYNDTLALEMEAIGFATAIQPHHRSLHALAIRGISDLLDHKSDDFQQLAADRAAAVGFELLWNVGLEPILQENNNATGFPPTGNDNIIFPNANFSGNQGSINIGHTTHYRKKR